MGVDHRGCHVPVSEELLDRPDVVTTFEEVSGEGVTKSMTGCVLGDVGLADRRLDRPLDGALMEVMAANDTRLGLDIGAGRRENPLPCPLPPRFRILAAPGSGSRRRPSARTPDGSGRRRLRVRRGRAGPNSGLIMDGLQQCDRRRMRRPAARVMMSRRPPKAADIGRGSWSPSIGRGSSRRPGRHPPWGHGSLRYRPRVSPVARALQPAGPRTEPRPRR